MISLGLIPARYGSSRFPGKPLADINGKSMIQRVFEQAKKSDLDHVVVATDDHRIFDTVVKFGGQAIMTSTNHQCGTDRCVEALEKISIKSDLVVNIQGDEPFIQPQQINLVLGAFQKIETPIVTLAKTIDNEDLKNPNVVKVFVDDLRFANSFQRKVLLNSTCEKHIGIYGFKTDVIKEVSQLTPSKLEIEHRLEQWRWLQNDYPIYVAKTESDCYSVDTPKDLEKIRRMNF